MTTYDDQMDKARQALAQLHSWLHSTAMSIVRTSHRSEWNRWEREFQAIQASLDRPNSVQVALVGTTGAGKSTLLNSLLGVQLLQVGVAQSITSFVTLVRYAGGPGYRVEIEFSTREEWAAEVARFVDAATPGEDDDGEARSIVNNLRKRVEAVYGTALSSPADLETLRSRRVSDEAARIFAAGARVSESFPETKAMVQHLRNVVRAESPIWPLVKQVTISGPFDVLKGGIELADLPGTNDLNDARVDVTREFIRNAPYVWLVFSMKRGITADGRELLEREKIVRTLVLSGSYRSLQLIGTHADDVDPTVASQFGLDPDDHTNAELIAAYRRHFVESARPVLLQVVESLMNSGDDPATCERMRELARQAPIHAVSARAFNQMAGIVKSNVDFGLESKEETGIPSVQAELRKISDEVGAGMAARTARKRAEDLLGEMASFFRARAAAGDAAAARARDEITQEVTRFGQRVERQMTEARAQFDEKRRAFVARVKPMLPASIRGVERAAQSWQGTHWATLRAIVARDGVFKSPSTGKRYDFNEDVIEPLLNQLPVAWEAYFTTDLGAVCERLAQRLTDFAEDFVEKARAISERLGGNSQDLLTRQLAALRERVVFESEQCRQQVGQRATEIRRQAANGMGLAARNFMLPAYERASEERGTGVKARMLGHLQPSARAAATPIFDTIESDLVSRLGELEAMMRPLLDTLQRVCIDQAQRVAVNLNVDVDESRLPADVRALLNEMAELQPQ